MACPYFMPVAKLENGAGRIPPGCPSDVVGADIARHPATKDSCLTGQCSNPSATSDTPVAALVARRTRRGMRSGSRFQRPPISTREKSLQDVLMSRSVRFASSTFASARHLPVSHGELEFDLLQASWLHKHDDLRMQKMAECFLESYLKKKA